MYRMLVETKKERTEIGKMEGREGGRGIRERGRRLKKEDQKEEEDEGR